MSAVSAVLPFSMIPHDRVPPSTAPRIKSSQNRPFQAPGLSLSARPVACLAAGAGGSALRPEFGNQPPRTATMGIWQRRFILLRGLNSAIAAVPVPFLRRHGPDFSGFYDANYAKVMIRKKFVTARRLAVQFDVRELPFALRMVRNGEAVSASIKSLALRVLWLACEVLNVSGQQQIPGAGVDQVRQPVHQVIFVMGMNSVRIEHILQTAQLGVEVRRHFLRRHSGSISCYNGNRLEAV